MNSLNFIGGEKGGVGKSVVARLLAQYLIDRSQRFVGFDTDRSHTSFTRFYEEYASPVVVDTYEGLDQIVGVFEAGGDSGSSRVIVDLAAQTAAPLARWIHDSDLLGLLAEMRVAVNFWHVADQGKDSVELLDRLIECYGDGPNYFVVKNFGRGSDFSMLDRSEPLAKAVRLGTRVIAIPALHEGCMRKIDQQNASFWAAANNKDGKESLGLLERQRVKTWLKSVYGVFDQLPV